MVSTLLKQVILESMILRPHTWIVKHDIVRNQNNENFNFARSQKIVLLLPTGTHLLLDLRYQHNKSIFLLFILVKRPSHRTAILAECVSVIT